MHNNLLILLLAFFISCGKDLKDSRDENKPQREEQTVIVVDEYLKNQKLICEDKFNCRENIAKIFVIDKDKVETCTGILTENNKLITSASCIPRKFRIPNLKCSENIFILFPETSYLQSEIIGCDRVENTDNNLYKEPALWQNDLLVLSLDSRVRRIQSRISKLGLSNSEELDTWKIEKENDFISIIKKDSCRIFHNTYLNPFSESKMSPMQVATECSLESIHGGSPLMRGNLVAGIFNSEMQEKMYQYLEKSDFLLEKLQRYYHVSNTACSRFLYDIKEPLPIECSPLINVLRLDNLRSDKFKDRQIHQSNMQNIETKLESSGKYFKLNYDFYTNQRGSSFEADMARPRCIFQARNWIGEFSTFGGRRIYTYAKVFVTTPKYIFKIKLNKHLKAVSVLEDAEEKQYTIEFNPFDAYVNNQTSVTITSNLLGRISTKTFDNITSDCN